MIAGGVVAAFVAVGLVDFLGARRGQPRSAPSNASSQPTSTLQPATTVATPRTVTQTAPAVIPLPPPRAPNESRCGDLGLSMPMSYLTFDGQGIVILRSSPPPAWSTRKGLSTGGVAGASEKISRVREVIVVSRIVSIRLPQSRSVKPGLD